MITRRSITAAFAGLIAAMSLKEVGAAQAKTSVSAVPNATHPISHTIFGNVPRAGLTWVEPTSTTMTMLDRSDVRTPLTIRHYETLQESLQAVTLQGRIAEIEHNWLRSVRDRSPVIAVFNQEKNTGTPALIGDTFAALSIMIRTAALHDRSIDTAIVSPTALTIIQSTTNSRFERIGGVHLTDLWSFGPKLAGLMPVDNRGPLRVLVDTYADEGAPILLGHVPVLPEERPAQVVRTGIDTISFGASAGSYDGWKRIDINAASLTFI